jgi:hypothetical protein
LLIIGIVVLLVIAALVVSVTAPFGTGTARSGPYPAGMRYLVTDGDPMLDMAVWYPAANDANPDAKITYPYKIGMPAPRDGLPAG